MSVIWRAHDEMLERGVALKVLAADLAADSRFRDLVRAEARAAAAMVHPYVTATYDYGETINADGGITAYVVMELLEGESLSARLTAGPLPWPEALRICAEVAEALAAAHRHGIVHRDVTADNIMLTDSGAKVLDFGIATTVGAPDEDSEGLTFGTPAYVAPERLDGRRARPANDTYALGVLIFETVTGNPPNPAETWEELAATRHEEPPRLAAAGLPEAVTDLCQQCLAVDPHQRPTAHQVAWTLRRQLPGAGRRTIHHSGIRRTLTAVGAAAVLALGVLMGTTVFSPDADTPEAYQQQPGGDGSQTPPDGEQPDTRDGPPIPGVDVIPPLAGEEGLPGADAAPDPGAGSGDGTDGSLTGAPSTEVTLDTISQLVADGQAQGDIRDDVAHDLLQVIDNLQLDLATDSGDLATGAEQIRDKVRAREREGSLGTAWADQLYIALDQLGAQA
jgi:serine/threonine-protein kinase